MLLDFKALPGRVPASSPLKALSEVFWNFQYIMPKMIGFTCANILQNVLEVGDFLIF